jgi:hypothetical protein
MSLRDWFAGHIASAIICNDAGMRRVTALHAGILTPPQATAHEAYAVADALLAERAK